MSSIFPRSKWLRKDNQTSLLVILVINGMIIRIKSIFVKKSLLLGTYSKRLMLSYLLKKKDMVSTFLEGSAAHIEIHREKMGFGMTCYFNHM